MTSGFAEIHLLLALSLSLLFAGAIEAVSYDYSATIECLAEPKKPQYGGGIIVNPEFNHGLKGWSAFGGVKIEKRKSREGNNFVVAHGRNQQYDGLSQKIHMEKDKLYTLSAWIQVSEGNAPVTAVVKTSSKYRHAGAVVAQSGCWSMLKGGLTVDSSGPAEIYFESKNTTMEIWVDSVSLKPFTKHQWRSHQQQSIEKKHKLKVRFQAVDAHGRTMAGAKVSISQNKLGFPFGSAINKAILNNPGYQNWFTSRFTVTTFEDEMKWYSTENSQGKIDYSVPDAMLSFAQQHGIGVRAHNIFWDDSRYQPKWLYSLSPAQLNVAVWERINSIMQKYAGKVIAWDVVNEILHFSFFEDKLGKKFSGSMFYKAHSLDPNTLIFINDYNSIEETGDKQAIPAVFLNKLREIQSYVGQGVPIGIGLEGHFKTPNIPYMRASIDALAATGMPIWLTEVDVEANPNQAQYLEEILREAHSHPAVKGIVMWAAWHPEGCYRMCLTDNNFKNLPTGNVVDKLISEWSYKHVMGTTDSNGFFETQLFHGDYNVTISHPSNDSSMKQSFKMTITETSEEIILHANGNVS